MAPHQPCHPALRRPSKRVGVVFRPMPGHAPADVQVERGRCNLDGLRERFPRFVGRKLEPVWAPGSVEWQRQQDEREGRLPATGETEFRRELP